MKLLSLLFVVALTTSMAFAQSKKEVVSTKDAPHPIAPYSQAIKAGGFVFCAQIPNDMTGKIVEGDIKVQTERVLKNISAVLAAAGSGMDRVVKATVFLKNVGLLGDERGLRAILKLTCRDFLANATLADDENRCARRRDFGNQLPQLENGWRPTNKHWAQASGVSPLLRPPPLRIENS